MRWSTIRKRLERLEAARQKQVNTTDREAWVELRAGSSVETHFVTTSNADDRRWYFQQLPGPGKQLSDYGHFSLVMYLTSHEMRF
jgi:hypothetical protein